jgi:hypothetical protein
MALHGPGGGVAGCRGLLIFLVSATLRLEPGKTAFLFDLDGTLLDSFYRHVLARGGDRGRH